MFDTTGFIPKYRLGNGWTYNLKVLAILPNIILVVFFIYIAIRSMMLWHKYLKSVPKKTLFRLLVITPLFFALSRFGYVLEFYWPMYRLYVFLDWLCAIAIVIFASRFPDTLEYIIRLPVLEDQISQNLALENEVKARIEAQNELAFANQNLILIIEKLESVIKTEIWLHDKKKALEELDNMLVILGKPYESNQ